MVTASCLYRNTRFMPLHPFESMFVSLIHSREPPDPSFNACPVTTPTHQATKQRRKKHNPGMCALPSKKTQQYSKHHFFMATSTPLQLQVPILSHRYFPHPSNPSTHSTKSKWTHKKPVTRRPPVTHSPFPIAPNDWRVKVERQPRLAHRRGAVAGATSRGARCRQGQSTGVNEVDWRVAAASWTGGWRVNGWTGDWRAVSEKLQFLE